MKKVYYYILAICLTPFLTGCVETISVPVDNDDIIEVPLRFSGDITVEETSLDTRASSSDYLYGIQVYQEGEKYAYGLFDDVSNLKLYLHSGKKYKVVCTLVRDGKNVLKKLEKTTQTSPYFPDNGYLFWYGFIGNISGGCTQVYANEGDGYGYPFAVTNNTYSNLSNYEEGWSGRVQDVCNRFIYSSTDYMPFLSSGRIITLSATLELALSPCVDRYYGESQQVLPTNDNPILIELKRVSYSVKYSISGITDGSVSITIKNANRTFFDDSELTGSHESEEIVCCFDDILGAWKYADNYTENLTISMKWMRGVGIEQDLGSQVFQVKRGAANVIEIALDTN